MNSSFHASAFRIASKEEQKKFEALQNALPVSGLFAEKTWRCSPTPFVISEEFQKKLEQLGHRLHQFNKACDLLYRQSVEGKQPQWISEVLDYGKPSWLIELARDKAFKGETACVIRPDLILTEEGFTICELDQVPGGIGLTAWLQKIYSQLGYTVLGGNTGMLEGFHSLLPGGDILISEEAATYRPEMQYCVEELTKLFPELKWRLLEPEMQEKWASQVYRFFELFDINNIHCARTLFTQARFKQLMLTPPPKPQLEEKLWFALFWVKPLQEFWRRELTERGFEQLKKVIPYSWILNPAPLPPHAVYPRLNVQSWDEVRNFSQQERDLVIKISGFNERAWGSRGVIVGSDVSKAVWQEALGSALSEYSEHPHLLQEFHHSQLQTYSYFSSPTEITEMKGRVRLTPYYFVSENKVSLKGGLATICPADKKVLHGMSEAILVPVSL